MINVVFLACDKLLRSKKFRFKIDTHEAEVSAMVHVSVIEARLSQLGVKLSRWFQAELRELQHVLFEHEKIVSIVPGRYFAGYALLVATDQRLLLIDKRTFFLTVDDIRYDMIAETDYSARLMDATVQIFTLNKQHRFTAFKYKRQLRELTSYVQRRVMDLRQGTPSPETNTPLGRYSHVSSFLPDATHTHPVSSPVSTPLATHKSVGAAAIGGVNRLKAYSPTASHVSHMYTGPTLISGFINRR